MTAVPIALILMGKIPCVFIYILQSYNLGLLGSARGMFIGWGGFLNIFQTTRREDLGVKMIEDEREKVQSKVSLTKCFKVLQSLL